MGRQLKFRVWSRRENKYLSSGDLSNFWIRPNDFTSCFMEWRPDFDGETVFETKETDFVYHQFTGILDTEGREIYEGDILQVLNADEEWLTPSVVVWSKYDEAGYSLANISEIEDWQKPLIGHTVNGIELTEQYPMMNKRGYKIMGNVFENPELLKQDE